MGDGKEPRKYNATPTLKLSDSLGCTRRRFNLSVHGRRTTEWPSAVTHLLVRGLARRVASPRAALCIFTAKRRKRGLISECERVAYSPCGLWGGGLVKGGELVQANQREPSNCAADLGPFPTSSPRSGHMIRQGEEGRRLEEEEWRGRDIIRVGRGDSGRRGTEEEVEGEERPAVARTPPVTFPGSKLRWQPGGHFCVAMRGTASTPPHRDLQLPLTLT
ncbi:unnamed protein product [Pleuronectes platessa]|uniref:Uncharacterized protein n=1 Tax=Pleuronectes platessa TaxID=8262 RepID=A0A9N7Y9Y5_PLEPL|nr:unnamed protein product [Pleuronectes platessa]